MQGKNSFSDADANQAKPGFSPEDLAKLFNYPAIGELFEGNDDERIGKFAAKMESVHSDLERIVRYGNQAEAESATRAIRGIEETQKFLKTLQKMRLEEKK